MVAYKGTSPKKSKSFFSSGSFLVLVLICIASLTAYLISNSNHSQNWVQKISYNSRSTVTKQLTQNNTPSQSDAEKSQAIEVVPSPSADINALAAEPESKTEDPTQQQETISADVRITFAEVSRDELISWTNESQKQDLYQSFVDFSAGIVPGFKTKFQSKYKELKTEQKKLFLKKPQALLLGKTIDDTSEFVGFQTNLDLKSKDNQNTKGHINITKITRYGKTEIPIDFELQKEALFFINWKTAMVGFENENLLFTTPPFQILKSADFLNQKTEFIILIEPLSP